MNLDRESKLFCDLSVDLGYITKDQADAALQAKNVDQAIGIVKPIGGYLHDQGLLSKEQVGNVIKMRDRMGPSHAPLHRAEARGARSTRSRLVFVLLALFLGGLGIHNFYAGYGGRGVTQLMIMLFTGWLGIGILINGIWALIEIVAVDTDADGLRMT